MDLVLLDFGIGVLLVIFAALVASFDQSVLAPTLGWARRESMPRWQQALLVLCRLFALVLVLCCCGGAVRLFAESDARWHRVALVHARSA